MAKKLKEEVTDDLSDDEAEQRAMAALRRALTTPYKPQSKIKIGRKSRPKGAGRKRRQSKP